MKKEVQKKKLFVCKAKDIKRVFSSNIEECILDYRYINNNFLNDKYLIFENIDDGFAREYYSKLIFNLKYKSEDNNITFQNENQKIINFYNQYKKSLRVPLLIELPNNYIFKNKLDSEIKKVLQNNVAYEYQIISALNEIEKNAKEELKSNIGETLNKKYENALCLNYLEYMKKTH